MKLSIVSSMYGVEKYVDQFCQRCISVANQIAPDDFEILLIDDGSKDRAPEIVKTRIDAGERIRMIQLSRNFGHFKAMMCGLEHAVGDFVFLLDSDLEEPPELLLEFWKSIESNSNLDVVYGIQQERLGGIFERLSGQLFFAIFSILSDVPVEKNVMTARLMRRAYVEQLCSFKEHDLFFFGVANLVGYSQMALPVKKDFHGHTTYKLTDRIFRAIDACTSFSAKPLQMAFSFGIMAFVFSVIYSIYLAYRRLVLHYAVEGWTTVVISIWVLGGLILSSLGILGIYLSKIYLQVKHRPRAMIKEEVGPKRANSV